MKNRKLLLIVSLVLALTMSLGGTLAYLTDTDSEANVFELGNVEIDLTEDFEQGAELLPGEKIEKMPVITNTGDHDAWVWMIWSIPAALDSSETALGSDNIVHFNWYGGTANAGDPLYYTQDKYYNSLSEALSAKGITVPAKETIANDKMYWTVDKFIGTKTDENGIVYNCYAYLYNKALTSGETTLPSIHTVYMDSRVDIDRNGDLYAVVKGEATKLNWNINTQGAPIIYVNAYAMQQKGFETVDDAFAAYVTQWSTSGEDIDAIKFATPATTVATAEELVAALEAGEDVILTESIETATTGSNAYGKTAITILNGQTINGNGETLSVTGANGTWDSAINTTGGVIKNLTIDSGFRGIFINHNSEYSAPVVLENVTIDGPVYTISCDQGTNQGLTATDCTINGWTSYAATLGDAEFINCKFGEGSGYAFCRPYAPTTFVSCEFEAGFEIDPRAAVTFENCTLNGVAITADNLSTLVTSNIANATVK